MDFNKKQVDYLKQNLPRYKNKIDQFESAKNKSTRIRFLLGDMQELFSYFFIVKEDITTSKWIVGAISELILQIDDLSPYYTKPTKLISWLFLSDNKKAIDYYLDFDYVLHDIVAFTKTEVYGPMVISSLLLKGDKVKAIEELKYWRNTESYRDNIAFYHRLTNYYEALIYGDDTVISKSFNETFTSEYQNEMIKIWGHGEEYYSTLGNFCGKLSWMLGHEIEFDHPLIEMELVRINPLPDYPQIDKMIDLINEVEREI